MSSAVLNQTPAFSFIQRLHKSPAKAEHRVRQLCCYTASTPGRHAVEAYIADAFREQYDAHIEHFMPVLLTIETDHQIEAALGLRFGDQRPLFLEHYLDQSVEAELAAHGLPNSAIVEVGNLVSTRAGCSQLLFILLAELLDSLGCDTGVFTATTHVQQLLCKAGCELTTLCDADGNRLGPQLSQWGSYYETAPRVVAYRVAPAAQSVRERPVLARTFKHHRDDLARVIDMLAPGTSFAAQA
ncbi:MAG: thermostable hemolysin [Spongiibacteraceae bacterium]